MDEIEILKKIAFNIKVERLRKGFTQFQLAEMIDVHEKYIGKVESGKQNITIKTLIKLATALDTNLTKLVKIDDYKGASLDLHLFSLFKHFIKHLYDRLSAYDQSLQFFDLHLTFLLPDDKQELLKTQYLP